MFFGSQIVWFFNFEPRPQSGSGGPSLDGGRANGTPMSLAAFDTGTCLRVEIPPGLRTEARQWESYRRSSTEYGVRNT